MKICPDFRAPDRRPSPILTTISEIFASEQDYDSPSPWLFRSELRSVIFVCGFGPPGRRIFQSNLYHSPPDYFSGPTPLATARPSRSKRPYPNGLWTKPPPLHSLKFLDQRRIFYELVFHLPFLVLKQLQKFQIFLLQRLNFCGALDLNIFQNIFIFSDDPVDFLLTRQLFVGAGR